MNRSLREMVLRNILSFITDKCTICNKSRLYNALNIISSNSENECKYCKIVSIQIQLISIIVWYSLFIIIQLSYRSFKRILREEGFQKLLNSYLKGISVFGIQKPLVPYAPINVFWSITNRCNLICQHCFIESNTSSDNELTLGECKKVIDLLSEWGVLVINYSGGEAICRDDFFKILNYSHKKNIINLLTTNGTMISSEIVKKLRNNGLDFINISIDGKKETHDKLRGMGNYDRAIQAIKYCKEHGYNPGISLTANSMNVREIPEIIVTMKKLGVAHIGIRDLLPVGRGSEISDLILTKSDRYSLLEAIMSMQKTYVEERDNFQVYYEGKLMQPMMLESDNEYFSSTFFGTCVSRELFSNLSFTDLFNSFSTVVKIITPFAMTCSGGIFGLHIMPNGDITPCPTFQILIGNVKSDSFEDIWKNNQIMRSIRNKSLYQGKCKTCSSIHMCGGCRARAYANTGNYLSEDPGCPYSNSYIA